MTSRHLLSTTALALAVAAGVGPALADVFSIDEPEVVKGEQELELNAAVQDGFPANAEPIRHSWELIYTSGVTNWVSIAPKIDFDRPLDDQFNATVIVPRPYGSRSRSGKA